jgi:hypothetical protein
VAEQWLCATSEELEPEPKKDDRNQGKDRRYQPGDHPKWGMSGSPIVAETGTGISAAVGGLLPRFPSMRPLTDLEGEVPQSLRTLLEPAQSLQSDRSDRGNVVDHCLQAVFYCPRLGHVARATQ